MKVEYRGQKTDGRRQRAEDRRNKWLRKTEKFGFCWSALGDTIMRLDQQRVIFVAVLKVICV